MVLMFDVWWICKSAESPNLALLTEVPELSLKSTLLPFVSNAPPNCGDVSETKSVLTVWNVESPLKNVEELAVPDPNLAVGTVPDDIFDAFRAVNPDPLPVAIPVKNTSPSLLKVIPLPTTIPFLAVINPTESTLVTSS